MNIWVLHYVIITIIYFSFGAIIFRSRGPIDLTSRLQASLSLATLAGLPPQQAQPLPSPASGFAFPAFPSGVTSNTFCGFILLLYVIYLHMVLSPLL